VPFILILWGYGPSLLRSQSTSGSILGVVTDPSSALVGSAEVSAENEATGVRSRVETGSAGAYAIPNLVPGRYRITVKKQGFKVLVRAGIDLIIDQKLRLDLALEMGEITEIVNVDASAPQLQTESAETGQVIGNRQILDLPLLGRNFLTLALLVPGVAAGAGGNNANYSIAGQREFGNSIVINGIEVTGNRNNDTNVRPSVEAVEEFKALTSSYAAEFGRAAGGVIAIQTRAGGNQLHGSAYEFLRTSATTARTFFASSPAALQQNNFGASAGGPIARNRTFFFASYEGLRSRDTWSYLDTTIPAGMVHFLANGGVDLSALRDPLSGKQIPIFDPAFYNANYYSQVFPGNVIPASRVSPAGSKILQRLFPAPNAPGVLNGWFSNFNVRQPYQFASDTFDARVDHVFSDRDRLSVTYDAVRYNSLAGDRFDGQIPIPGGGSADSSDRSDSLNQSAAVSWLHVSGPRQFNELRAGYVRAAFQQNDLIHGTDLAQQFGIANANIPGFPQTSGFPQIQLGFGPITGGSTYKPLSFLDNNLQLGDSYSWIAGRHSWKFGYEFRSLESHPDFSLFPSGYQYYSGAYGSVTSDPTYAYYDPASYYGNGGNEIADLLLGLPGWVAQGLQLTHPVTKSHEHHFFAQDAWQIGAKIVLTYGVRYELQSPYTEVNGNAANFDPATKSMLLAGRGDNSDALLRPDRNNFAPRLGIAWRVSPKIVLRAGWGVFYTPENGARSDVLTKNYPFFIQQTFSNYPGAGSFYVLDSGVARPTSVSIPPGASSIDLTSIPAAKSQTVYFIDPNFRTGYAQMMNLTVEYAISPQVTVETGYVGAVARKLPYAVGDVNLAGRISSQIGIVQGLFSEGASDYHSLQIKANRRFSRGYGFLIAYTFAKSIDNGPAPFNLGRIHQQPQDPFNLTAERALSSTDLRHNLVLSNLWALPFAERLHGFPRALLDGWHLNGIGTLHSGLPVNVVRNGSVVGYQGLRPNVLGDPNLPSDQQTLARYFDTKAFSITGLSKTQPGNAGRNILRGPGFIDIDLSLFKNITLRENIVMQIRIESFNVSNTPNFAAPNGDLSTGQFGQITQTVGIPRILQFAVKIKF
jgi:hypothetical protein